MGINTKKIKVGNIFIGGSNDVIIQSMTNTKTSDVEATVSQILALETAGCELVRVTVNDMAAAKAIKAIKEAAPDLTIEYKLPIITLNKDGSLRGKGGLKEAEGIAFAKKLEEAGVDMIQVAQGIGLCSFLVLKFQNL